MGNGIIISQSPKPGTVLKQGATLSVVPSIGPPAVAVPSLTGMNCAQATTALTNAHLKGGCIAGQYSDTVPNGVAITWSYDGAQDPQTAPYGSIIDIVPSLGHGPVPVPTTISQTDSYQDALVLLQAAGLNGTEAYAYSGSGVPVGRRHLTHAAQRHLGALRVDRHRDRVEGAADHDGAQRLRRYRAAGHHHAAGRRPDGVGCAGQPERDRHRHRSPGGHDGPDGFVGADPGPLRTERAAPAMALPFDASCDLCEAARLTPWHHEDDVCWVADCEICDVPMVVWKHHGPTPPDDDLAHMVAQLTRVADARFGEGGWAVDRVMRQIPNHFHAHGRDPNWWSRRFR